MNTNNIHRSDSIDRIRNQYLDYLAKVKEFTEQAGVPDHGLTDLTQRITHIELLIPVVGGFGAGKSTLINSLLGSNLLPTAITPETALATELRYSETDYIEAINSDGHTEQYDLTQFVKIKENAKNFKFLRLFLNNSNLAEIKPLILVDMPGFDAPIENHNKAILNYLNRGTHFVFLVSVEDGTITRTMHQEIKNLHLLGKSFSFGISKTDLRLPDDVQKVKSNISEQLVTQYNYNGNVALFDAGSGENLKEVLTIIRPELLFKSLFIDDLKNHYFNTDDSINLKIATLNTDKSRSEQTIQDLEHSISKIRGKKQKAIADAEKRYSTRGVDSIVNAVGSAISNQRDSLFSFAMNSPDEFQQTINTLVRNNLLAEVKNRIEDLSDQIIQDFKVELYNTFSAIQYPELGNDFAQKIVDNSEFLLKTANDSLQKISKTMAESANNNEKTTALYQHVATIVGITARIAHPVLNIMLFFLPEITSFVNNGIKETRARRQLQEQRSQIEQQLITEIIPQIKGKIRTELPSLIKQGAEQMIQQVGNQFEEQLAQKQTEIQKAMEEKEQETIKIQALIDQLKFTKLQLANLAQTVIFT